MFTLFTFNVIADIIEFKLTFLLLFSIFQICSLILYLFSCTLLDWVILGCYFIPKIGLWVITLTLRILVISLRFATLHHLISATLPVLSPTVTATLGLRTTQLCDLWGFFNLQNSAILWLYDILHVTKIF